MKHALLSVYYKHGIVEFARALISLGYKIYASGGTHKHLVANNVAATDVADLVGEAILGHRVVTLSREVHAALLAKITDADDAELARLGIPRFDLVCVDLYPLAAEIAKPDCTLASVIEQTDIGGPTMIRSGAKGRRIVVCDPDDREKVIEWLKAGEPEGDFVNQLCAKGEFVIAKYCMLSANYLSGGEYIGLFGRRVAVCKYGENPQQAPAHFYSDDSNDPLALERFSDIDGSALGANNLCDLDRALQTATLITKVYEANGGVKAAIAVGVKHGNPCGASAGIDQSRVLEKMMEGDPLAIFGGFILLNFTIDEVLADVLARHLRRKTLAGIIAPGFTDDAVTMLRPKSDKCRFVVNPALATSLHLMDESPRERKVRGGRIVQPGNLYIPNFSDGTVLKHGTATLAQEADMLLAAAIGATSNSNTITIVKDGRLIGNGVGQQDRVGAAELAIWRARRAYHDLAGASAYSDSFFPFKDGPQVLIDAGIKAIFATSGSQRDSSVIDLCKQNEIALYMVPDRLGRGFFGH